MLFCGSIGFIPPGLMGALSGTLSWWWVLVPTASLICSSLKVNKRKVVR